MSRKANPTLVGSFVIGAIALIVVAIVALGSGDWFESHLRAVAYFEGSVNGLNVGAPVTWRGVRIGSVTEIRIEADPVHRTFRIPVIMEFDPTAVTYTSGDIHNLSIHDLVQHGLRAQLQTQSLVTGQLFVDLNLMPETPLKLVGPQNYSVPEIPTVKSVMATLEDSLQDLPVKQIGTAAIGALNRFNDVMSSPDLKTILGQIAQSSQELSSLLADVHGEIKPMANSVTRTADTLQETLKDAQGTLAGIQKATSDADVQIGQLSGDARAALSSANHDFQQAQATLNALNSLIAPNSPQRADIDQIMRNLTYSTQSLRALSQELERNPNALLMGTK